MVPLKRAEHHFFYLTSAAVQYGLTKGTRDTAEISLTELGRTAVYPSSAEQERAALREAFFNVDSFRQVLEHYGGNNLPEKQYRENTLFTNYGLDPEVQDEFVDLLDKNCRFVGIGERLPDVGQPTVVTTGPVPTPAETIAKPPATDDAPTCFVIMPFTEREDRHPAGFFEEVLASLFTPAVTDAGLSVRTAQRRGSDVIQSTILRELLAADLVLADLTEHNPNVLFELGMRIAEDKPVVLVRARGTGAIFDVDNLLRVEDYSPNLWPSTLKDDVPRLRAHVAAAWENQGSTPTYKRTLLGPGASPDAGA